MLGAFCRTVFVWSFAYFVENHFSVSLFAPKSVYFLPLDIFTRQATKAA